MSPYLRRMMEWLKGHHEEHGPETWAGIGGVNRQAAAGLEKKGLVQVRGRPGGWEIRMAPEAGKGRPEVRYYADQERHLVCCPYGVQELHAMAEDLEIHRCWYHAGASRPHYDIPKRRVEAILTDPRITVVSPRTILAICKGEDPPWPSGNHDDRSP